MKNFLYWRKTTWALIAWTSVIAVWLIVDGLSAPNAAADCAADPAVLSGAASQEACLADASMSPGIGPVLITAIWVLGSIVLTAIWFTTRPMWQKGRGMRLRRWRAEDVPSVTEPFKPAPPLA